MPSCCKLRMSNSVDPGVQVPPFPLSTKNRTECPAASEIRRHRLGLAQRRDRVHRSPPACLRISGFLDTKFDTVNIEFGTAVNELHRPPCRELHEAHRLLEETGDTFAAGDTILMGS